MRRYALAAVPVVCTLLGGSVAYAQRGGGDWTTGGFDVQRSSWVRNDAKISPESMRKPGFELVWKLDLNEKGGRPQALTPPVLLDFYIGYRGFRTLGFFGGSSGSVIGVDTDLARIEWRKKLEGGSAGSRDPFACPGGMTAGVVRTSNVGYPPLNAGRGAGRGNPARSGVGAPGEGAVTLKPAATPPVNPPPPPVPPGSAASTTRRVATAPNPFAPRAQYVHAVGADGKFHSFYVSNGEEPKPAVPFLPANANAQGLMVFDNVAYAAATNNCGGVENGVWALNMESQKVSHWKAGGRAVSVPAAGPDGTLYVTSGGELVALEEKTLKPKGSYAIGKQEFTSAPVVFDFKDKDLIAVASNDGQVHLLDAGALNVPVAKTPAFSSADFAAGALASWQDPAGARWLLAPAGGATPAGVGFKAANGDVKTGAIVAWKVVEQKGALTLQPGWVSRDMVAPLTPIVVNGVIFAVSSGEFRTSDAKVTPAQRAQRSSRAVLYALDSATGKELWNSGETISGFVKTGGLAAGGSRVYVASNDGTQYVFGFPIEH